MQVKHFTVLSLTLAGIVSVSGLFADTSEQWNDNAAGNVTVSKNLQWKRLPPKSVKPVVHATDSAKANSKRYPIQQVQLLQPVTPPMTPAQRDTIYPELRPQERTVPGGATLLPTPPPVISKPRAEVPKETAPTKEDEPKDESRQSRHYTDSPAKTVEKTAVPESTLPAKPLPAPIPPRTTDITVKPRTGKGIICPDDAGFKSIRDISVDIRPKSGELPTECPLIATSYNGRHFDRMCFQWKASAVCTKGAYLEDVQLERYGHSVCPVLQPVISGAKFFATVPLLPYKMGITPPNECVYTLGYYRPGNCAPYMLDPFPISVRAVAFEALAVGGAVAVIP